MQTVDGQWTVDLALFAEQLARLTRQIRQPQQKIGRRRLPVSDMAFLCVYAFYARLSSRDLMARMEQMRERGYITKTCHFNSISSYLRDPTLTPALEEVSEQISIRMRAVAGDADDFGEFVEAYAASFRVKSEDADENQYYCADISFELVRLISFSDVHL